MSDERLSDVTRFVSLLARWSPTPVASDWSPDGMAAEDTEVEAWAGPCTDRLRRLSGPIVYGRVCGVRRRTASRCSRALPLAEDDGDEEEAVGAIAMVTAEGEVEKGGAEQQGGMRGQRRWRGRRTVIREGPMVEDQWVRQKKREEGEERQEGELWRF